MSVKLECFCGSVKGTLAVPSKKQAFHLKCLCCDCQKYAEFLGQEDKILDNYGGTELFQTYPSNVHFDQGVENISCMQLKEKGLYRWYASCCKAPLGNTLSSARVPFVGVPVAIMKLSSQQEKDSQLGPLIMEAFAKYARGSKPKNSHDKFPVSFLPKILVFMGRGLLMGRAKPHPFFHNEMPIVTPKVQ